MAQTGKHSFGEVSDEPDEEDVDTQAGKYLTFQIGKESYGLKIKYVTEIIGIQRITPVPDVPVFVKGLVNLRGRVVPVMDVRLRFRQPPRDYDDRTCIIVIHIDESDVGLVVDIVSEVLSIPDGDIEPPPRMGGGSITSFMSGLAKVGDEVKILLDAKKLLFEGLEAARATGRD